jgi:signal transduction histidine kinase
MRAVSRRRRQQQEGTSLRRRIAVGILGIATLTVLLFALPLGIALGRLDRSQEFARLQSEATRIAALVPDNPAANGQQLPRPLDHATLIGLYSPDGRRAAGAGPAFSRVSASTAGGRARSADEYGQLAVSVPVPSDRHIVAVIRAAVPLRTVTTRTHRSWLAMVALGAAVLLIVLLLALRQARRIARPLERLTAAVSALGAGNFGVVLSTSGIREADLAAAAITDTAARLSILLERERAFSVDASHQLRTPLTGLLLGLESALVRPRADQTQALRDALDRGRHLQSTIDDLLAIRRDGSGLPVSVDIGTELGAIVSRWDKAVIAAGRRLTCDVPHCLPPAIASSAAFRQIMDVLLDNALKHGSGVIAISTEEFGEAIALTVADDGPGFPADEEDVFDRLRPGDGHGIGLPLARSLAEADGGRLFIRHIGPGPSLVLLLPAAPVVIAAR